MNSYVDNSESLIINSECGRIGGNIFYGLILLAPVLSNYVFYQAVSFGDLFFFLALPWLFLKLKLSIACFTFLFFAAAFCLLSYYMLSLSDGVVYVGFYRLVFFYLSVFLVLFVHRFDIERFFVLYSKFAIFFSVAIIVQWILYNFFTSSISFQLPIEYYEPDTLKVVDHVYRSGGFFKEPSYFIIYIAPALLYFLLSRSFLSYLVVLFAGVLSTSSLIFFVFFVTLSFEFLRSHHKALFFPVTILISSAVLLFFYSFPELIFVERIIAIFRGGGTLNERFFSSFYLWGMSGILGGMDVYSSYLNDGRWFSSAAAIVSALGVLSFVLIVILFMRLGCVFGLFLVVLLLTTHFLSAVYAPFTCFSLLCVYEYSHRY